MSNPQDHEAHCANALHHFRLRVIEERTLKGWTQKDLAEASRISASTISKIENGRMVPTADQFWSLQSVLSINAQALYFDMQGRGAPLEPGMVAVPRELLVQIIRVDIEQMGRLGKIVLATPDWENADDAVLLHLIQVLRSARLDADRKDGASLTSAPEPPHAADELEAPGSSVR